MKNSPVITIVGSINMDLMTMTDQVPKMGETLLGNQFQMNPGGKGANQAIAAARLGANVRMIGCVGQDSFGQELVQHLAEQAIDVANVKSVQDSTGTAMIVVANQDNSIIVVPGANNHVTAAYVESKREIIAESDILLLQLEIPLDGVQKAAEIAKENGVTVILNPAPIQSLSPKLIDKVDYLTPNEHEYQYLQGELEEKELKEKVIVTKGSQGVMFYQEDKEVNIPAYKVDVIDTTGAGDSFNGGFAFALSKGASIMEACQYGNAAAALSTTKLGAQMGVPCREAVEEFINTSK